MAKPSGASLTACQRMKRSYFAASLGRFDRSKTLLEIDEVLHLDDLVLEVGADVDLFFNVTDVDVAYGHAYVDDDRVRTSRQLQPVRPPGVAVHVLPLTPHELDAGLKDLVELPGLPPSGPGSGRE